MLLLLLLLFLVGLRPKVGHELILEVSRPHTTKHHSWYDPWTSDQPLAETSTWQHTALITENIPATGGIRTHNLST